MASFLIPKKHGQKYYSDARTWIIELLKANDKGEKGSGYELEVVSHHIGPHETF